MAINTAILAKVKTSLRISHSVLDEDVADTVGACLADLQMAGILADKLDSVRSLDPLILNAVKLYCKASYTDDTAKAARYQDGYDALKACLMLAEGYGYEEVDTDE